MAEIFLRPHRFAFDIDICRQLRCEGHYSCLFEFVSEIEGVVPWGQRSRNRPSRAVRGRKTFERKSYPVRRAAVRTSHEPIREVLVKRQSSLSVRNTTYRSRSLEHVSINAVELIVEADQFVNRSRYAARQYVASICLLG